MFSKDILRKMVLLANTLGTGSYSRYRSLSFAILFRMCLSFSEDGQEEFCMSPFDKDVVVVIASSLSENMLRL